MAIKLKSGETRKRDKLLRQLSDIQYHRNDIDFGRSAFRVRGDVVDIFPASGEDAYKIDFFGDEIENITKFNPLTGEILEKPSEIAIYPGSHYVTPHEKVEQAIGKIQAEYEERKSYFLERGMYLEEQRLSQRIKFDLEMLKNTGFVKGIENYSRYLTNRSEGDQPATLLDYFPDDSLMIIDESHMTIPQIRGMYNGDRARKETLVNYGFRLPSALDNRPLRFDEFVRHQNQTIYVSATPAEYELSLSSAEAIKAESQLSATPKLSVTGIVEQIIRPTGLLDPEIEVRPVGHQVDDAVAEIKNNINNGERTLVTTLTKRMAEDLSEYLEELKIKVAYIHSDVDTVERTEILQNLRRGVYDVLVGINLLREGLDLPEVSSVLILDADKEGFLRSSSALIQTIGRAARHEKGRVIMYADNITKSMKLAIDETNYRRAKQIKFNQENGIIPHSIQKDIEEGIRGINGKTETKEEKQLNLIKKAANKIPKEDKPELIKELTAQMQLASKNLEFERAAELRDVIEELTGK
jgi:excinuclease ABC subunit B